MLPNTIPANPITVAIYSPSHDIAQHLKDALDPDPTITVLRIFSNVRRFRQFTSNGQVEVAILAVTSLDDFATVMRRIRQVGKVPECIAIVSNVADEAQALAHGAVGCIVPLALEDDCKLAVHRANHRLVYLTKRQAKDIIALLRTNNITPPELEGRLLADIAAGLSYHEVAATESNFSEETVAGHMYNLLAKLYQPMTRP